MKLGVKIKTSKSIEQEHRKMSPKNVTNHLACPLKHQATKYIRVIGVGQAVKALKEPQKKIGDRLISCQIASLGPVAGASAAGIGDVCQRRIYISNVHVDMAPDKLKDFFAQFGEIETGPTGFDTTTGKSRGFAMFVYKKQEGAKKALEEPHKMFDDRTLHCKLANDPGQKGKGPVLVPSAGYGASALLGTSSQPVMAAAQNMAMYGHSPAYALILGQNPLLAAATLNPTVAPAVLGAAAAATTLSPTAALLASQGQVCRDYNPTWGHSSDSHHPRFCVALMEGFPYRCDVREQQY